MNYDEMTDCELNAAIRKVFQPGAVVRCRDESLRFEPLSDIQDAFEVVKAMRARGAIWNFETVFGGWDATIDAPWLNKPLVPTTHDESLPRAICIAALRATDGL